jgi:CheY-like chemotaxis protein
MKPLEDKSASILLVEDEPISQRVAQLMLENLGHKVDVANTGEKALSLLVSKVYDLILMDLGLPDMTGDQVTIKIREREGNNKSLPIIALTAHVFHSDKKRCLAAGMNGFLGKPIEYAELQQSLQEWLKI